MHRKPAALARCVAGGVNRHAGPGGGSLSANWFADRIALRDGSDAPRASFPIDFPWRAWRLFSSNDLLPQNTVYAFGLLALDYLSLRGVATDAHGQLLLVLIDVDHFKRIDDTHGHALGDVVLQAVAAHLRLGVRDSDLLVRWGGEEFSTNAIRAWPVRACARCWLRSANQAIALGEIKLRISVSAGAAAYLPPGAADQQTVALAVEQAIARADSALYEAKARGRDRAVLVVDGAEGVVGNVHWTEFERVAPAETHAK